MGGTQSIIAQLESWGKKEGEFIQSRHISEHLEMIAEEYEGLCRGACMDWIRKVLQDGKIAFSDKRAESRTLRHFALQSRYDTRMGSTGRVNRIIELSNTLIGIRNAQIPLYNQDNSKDKVTLPQEVEAELKNFNKTFQPTHDHRYTIGVVKTLYGGLNELVKTERYDTEPGWQALAHKMDAVHRSQRDAMAAEEEKNPRYSKRPFTHIKIIDSADRKHYGNGSAQAALNTLLQLNAFTSDPRTALLLGFGLKVNQKETGHAVTVFRPDPSQYILFDPNYGVFRYPTIGHVFSALKYLFEETPKDSVFKGEPVYGSQPGEQVTGAVSYILFAHA